MEIDGKLFDIGSRTFIVGILNVTPDSFFDGGQYDSLPQAVKRAKKMVEDGADIIEIGGESSRPGFVPVELDVELERVIPIVKELKMEVTVPIAVDTYKSEVARAALQNGASVINDVMCFKKDPLLPKVCAEFGATCVIMHNRDNMNYDNLLLDVMADIKDGIDRLISAGVDEKNIIIDPGIGFAKDTAQNLTVLRNLSFFSSYPYPVMLGASRKSFIGHTLGFSVDERLEATLATTALAINQYCDFIRVHDVRENKRVAMMADEIIRNNH